jgi:pilus assembly protein TadC
VSGQAAAAVLLMSSALLLWVETASPKSRRLLLVLPVAPSPVGRRNAGRAGAVSRRWLAGTAGVAVALLLAGPAGVVAGLVAAGATEWLLRRAADTSRTERAALARDVPVACDLLAVCLSAGLPLSGALAEVASVLPGPAGRELERVAALCRLGAEPRRAWADVPDELVPLARVVSRAGESGARIASALTALSADRRAESRAGTEAAVRRAGIWVLAPLGLCFLPAFVCLGVVPLVLGIAADVF